MIDDEKVNFYLKHRAAIEEWKELRAPAVAALDKAIEASLADLYNDPEVPNPTFKEGPYRYSHLAVTEQPRIWLELNWDLRILLGGDGNWPWLIVGGRVEKGPLRDAVLAATLAASIDHEMRQTNGAGGVWLRFGRLAPNAEPIDPLQYAAYCVERLRTAWVELHLPIRDAVAEASPTSPA